MYDVAVVEYEKPYESLKKAIDEIGSLGEISSNSKVFIKPNIVTWHEGINFPKFGVLTTARLIEDIVIILNEHGVTDISLVEGVVEKIPEVHGVELLPGKTGKPGKSHRERCRQHRKCLRS